MIKYTSLFMLMDSETAPKKDAIGIGIDAHQKGGMILLAIYQKKCYNMGMVVAICTIIIGLLIAVGIVGGIAFYLKRPKPQDGDKNAPDSSAHAEPTPTIVAQDEEDKENELRIIRRIAGKRGEKVVAYALGKTIPDNRYVINEITVRDDDNRTFNIDHIYINRYGIWVIETKNYSGKLYGAENDEKWILQSHGKTQTRYNPIKQNQTHIDRLIKNLKIRRQVFHNIVVFTGTAEIFVNSDCVCRLNELHAKLKSDCGIRLSVDEMRNYYRKIDDFCYNNSITYEEHIEKINKNAEKFCPICGSELTNKYSEDGKFSVCTNTRNCTYSKKIGDGWG